MTDDARLEHALAQFEARYTMPFWTAGDISVQLPWWAAAPAYPLIIGTRILVWAGMVPFQALRNYLSWSAADTAAIPDDKAFVLVLRTFGHDGGMLVAPSRGRETVAPRAMTLEQIVSEIAERAGLSAVGFADHNVGSVPPGVRYHKLAHDDWREQFEQLAVSASAIVVMPTPGRELGRNFRSELAFLRERGLASKSVVVGPPGLDDATRTTTHEVYRELGWPVPDSGYLCASVGTNGRLRLGPAFGAKDDHLAFRYETHLSAAIRQVLASPNR